MAVAVIEATDISKKFGTVTALDGVSITIPEGAVLGLLGHNGAGKTTLVNILTTLVQPTSGSARVSGFDVVKQAIEVRSRIGLTGQFAAVDEDATGFENLLLIARLLGATRRQAKARADELLAALDLTDAGNRLAGKYSGGMRRRLDLAASLVASPKVIFLDEPTTGLDPTSRANVWGIIEQLVESGTSVLLTTQYLEEADRLADSITVLSQGKTVASGTPTSLKAGVGERTVTVSLVEPATTPCALATLSEAGLSPSHNEELKTITMPVSAPAKLATVIRALDGFELAEVNLAEPTLDDVYLALTNSTPPAGRTAGAASEVLT